MKEIRIILEDKEYEELLKKKNGVLTWKELMLKNIDSHNQKKLKG